MTNPTPVEAFDDLRSKADLLLVVYYRGHWCPFCMSYLKNLQSLKDQVAAANGTTLIVTAEPSIHLPASRSASGYTGPAIVDPENILAAELKQRGCLQLAISNKSGYVHGMAQPAILVIKKDGTVLYSWAIAPTLMNLQGAKDRPTLKEVWENVLAGLDGRPPVHQKYSKTTIISVMCGKYFG